MSRATYLLKSDMDLLNHWASYVRTMFRATPYLVGSVLTTPTWRDVDVRLILDDDAYQRLAQQITVSLLDLSVSLWGRKATGLPIDFQVQQMTEANREFDGRRNALGLPAPKAGT